MMCSAIATMLTILGTVSAQTDTTFKVRPGMRLDVNNFGGAIVVQAWDKNAVRIAATHSARIVVRIEEAGPSIEVRASSRRGIPGRVDYQISVPAWMPLALAGIYSDVTVSGARSEVSVETVSGVVQLHGGDGFIKLSSVQGAVTLDGARGRMELSSVNDGVSVTDVEGELNVEAVNGDVILDRVRSRLVEAATVQGDVRFVGGILAGGRYRFASHQGDLDVAIPERADATISVATFTGDFESDFPMVLSESKRGKQFRFALGDGSARIDLETFQGSIKLRRATAVKVKEK